MPTIKSSADLRNSYNDISTFCHNYPEPVFITKNGKGDLAVMSIETYNLSSGRQNFIHPLNRAWMTLMPVEPGLFPKQ